jgi:subtilisin family serine protease
VDPRAVGAVVASACLVLGVGTAAAHGQPRQGTHRYIVVLDGHRDARPTADRQTRMVGRDPEHVFTHALSGYTVRLTPNQAGRIAALPGVDSVEPDLPIHAADQSLPTGLDRVSAPDSPGTTGDPALSDGVDDQRVDADIAILDSGVADHPDLDVVARTDCTSGTCRDGTGTDVYGHGTHVAGIAAAIDNGIGTVGVAPGARIWSVKVLGDSGDGTLSSLVAGIDWVTAHHDVIDAANVSIECGCVSAAVDTALSRSVASGVPYAVAAGNESRDGSSYAISGDPDVMVVSALADFDGTSGGTGSPTCLDDQDDTLADFSNFGPSVDLTAPGTCILSTYPGGYATMSGTSMASPAVAGAAALLASDPAYHGDPAAIERRLVSDANEDWTDDSGDGVQEPLLDVSSIVPHTLPTSALPSVSVSDAWVVEGGSGAAAHFRVSTDRPLAGGESVQVTAATKGGSATSGKDFTPVSTKVVLSPGHETQTVDVPVSADDLPEGAETFTLALSAPLGGALADPTGTGTIVDPHGPLTLSAGNATAPESNAAASVPLTLSAPVPAGQKVTVKVSTADGTAKAGSDYTRVSRTVTFPAGTRTEQVQVGLLQDAVAEGDETFQVKLSSPKLAVLADSSATVTIKDDDPPLQVSVSDAWVAEGDSGTTPATFTVSLSSPPAAGHTVSVVVKTTDGSARSGKDYTALSSTKLVFDSTTASRQVTVPVLGDTVTEPNETFRLLLSSPVGATLADSSGLGTIADDDNGPPSPAPRTIAVSDARVVEAGFGSPQGMAVLTLSSAPGPGESVSVSVRSRDGSAVAGSDYVAVPPTTVTFGPGETVRSVPVAALDDQAAEPDETFYLDLSAPVGATLADPTSAVTVVSDEPESTVAAASVWTPEGDAGATQVLVPVTLSQAPVAGQTFSVLATTTPGTATPGTDYEPVSTRLDFAPGQSTATVAVTIDGDVDHETDETFTVSLSAPQGVVISDSAGTVTIVDEEGP